MDCGNAVIVMRTGLELLNFGYEPIEKVREDTVHYLGKCQALEKERMLIFGSVVIGIEGIRKMLNEHEHWNKIVKFVERSTP